MLGRAAHRWRLHRPASDNAQEQTDTLASVRELRRFLRYLVTGRLHEPRGARDA